MACGYQMRDLIRALGTKIETVEAWAAEHRQVQDGKLSVGLKIHCLDQGHQFGDLVEALGGPRRVLEINHYKNSRASLCLVLPPVGSASAAIQLVECMENFIGSPIFGNPKIQLQLCSPGRISPRASALLGIGFYLGSDSLRRYTQADLRTTFTMDCVNPRGMRLVLYDAEGDFDSNFTWWNEHGKSEPHFPFKNGRTDILIGSASRLDIQNVNLLATLLVHLEYGGYWHSLGNQFRQEMEALLDRHILHGILTAPWLRLPWAQLVDDDLFFSALQELVAYAYGEAARVKQRHLVLFNTWRDIPARASNGILEEVQNMLSRYRQDITIRREVGEDV